MRAPTLYLRVSELQCRRLEVRSISQGSAALPNLTKGTLKESCKRTLRGTLKEPLLWDLT